MQLVILGVLIWAVLTGGKIPDFIWKFLRPTTTPPTTPEIPDISKLLQLIPQLISMLTNRGEGLKLTGDAAHDRICCIECIIELGRCAEACGDSETADKAYDLIIPFVKMHTTFGTPEIPSSRSPIR